MYNVSPSSLRSYGLRDPCSHPISYHHISSFSISSIVVFHFILSLKISMEQAIVDSLNKLQLTKEEEEDIIISTKNTPDLLEKCSLSLFGRLLADRQQNQQAFKSTLRFVWKMGSNLRIMEVGNNILQFKFSSMYQLEWVE